jgi:uncharacterized protein (TIGR02001 family)
MRPDGAAGEEPRLHCARVERGVLPLIRAGLATVPSRGSFPNFVDGGVLVNRSILAALLSVCTVTAAVAPLPVLAQKSDWSASGNLSLVSDYRFRGVSQTYNLPAVQGGFDLGHSAGFYVGTWGSNVGTNDRDRRVPAGSPPGTRPPQTTTAGTFAGGSSLELDFYGGYRFEIARNSAIDIGVIYYLYPGAKDPITLRRFDTTEMYIGASFGNLTAKLNYGLSDHFGLIDSSGSYYANLGYVQPIAKSTNIAAHVGYQSVNNFDDLAYTDWKLGVTTEAVGVTWGLAYIGTNAKERNYTVLNASDGTPKEVAKDTIVFTVGKTF